MPIKPSELVYSKDLPPKVIGESKPTWKTEKESSKDFKFDEQKCRVVISDITGYFKSFAGKNTYNPYVYLSKEVDPLERALDDGCRDEELQQAICSLKKDEKLCHYPKLKLSQEEEKKQRETKILPKTFERR